MGSQTKFKVILIGLGSIGKVHLSKFTNFATEVVVIDPKSSTREYIEKSSLSKVTQHYTSLNQVSWDSKINLAVIANWGPDHKVTIEELCKKGVTNFLVEKPLVSKLEDLDYLCNLQKNLNLNIVTNFQWNFSGFRERINEIINRFELGNVVGISVTGGAKCIVTNGIHYLALASHIFDTNPYSVFARLKNDPINPRGENFGFFGGVALFEYPKERYFSLQLQNNSRLSARIELLLSDSRMEIADGKVKVFRIPKEKIDSFSKPAHTGYAAEIIFECEAFIDNDGKDGLDNLYQLILREKNINLLADGVAATRGIIGALLSSEKRKPINLTCESIDFESEKGKEWHIT